MANSKNKCTNCKKYFPAESMIVVPAGKFHVKQCLIDYGMKQTNKLIDKTKKLKKNDNALRKKSFRENDLAIRKEAAKTACHAYIKARDRGLPCICCGRPLDVKYDSGHYLESGNNPRIRYNEDNIHSQSVYCNKYCGGNSDDYRGNLIKKIGLKGVERLEGMKGGTVKRTGKDLKEIEVYYKRKLKDLR